MKRIAVGDMAPDFVLKDNRVQDIRLSDYRGKKVLLAWHPLAWTSVCANQMKDLEDNLPEFEKYMPAESEPPSKNLPALANIVADFQAAGLKFSTEASA